LAGERRVGYFLRGPLFKKKKKKKGKKWTMEEGGGNDLKNGQVPGCDLGRYGGADRDIGEGGLDTDKERKKGGESMCFLKGGDRSDRWCLGSKGSGSAKGEKGYAELMLFPPSR